MFKSLVHYFTKKSQTKTKFNVWHLGIDEYGNETFTKQYSNHALETANKLASYLIKSIVMTTYSLKYSKHNERRSDGFVSDHSLSNFVFVIDANVETPDTMNHYAYKHSMFNLFDVWHVTDDNFKNITYECIVKLVSHGEAGRVAQLFKKSYKNKTLFYDKLLIVPSLRNVSIVNDIDFEQYNLHC